ncbi:hypothetical protein [Pseudarthrobacter sp. S9]|uniref:hypothetical protein n=1 Tax=Pseudarthrobacter sp. S9 TaxID=3418421 RepID=UPI003CFE996E
MDSGQLIGIIVGIVVVLAILVVAIMFNRKRKVAADRSRAAEMREQAKADEFGAREREAKAVHAEADAQQAELEAERLRQEARGGQEEAESVRSRAQEQLRKADEMDPDVVGAERGDDARETTNDEELRRDGGAREHGVIDGSPQDPGVDHPRDGRPRNL